LINAILSIKPIYAHSILSGKKKVEFRKISFKREVKKIYIYSSAPDQQIIGYFIVKEIVSDKPSILWDKYNEVGSISKKDFFKYYSDKEIGYSILIKKVSKFKNPINPKSIFPNFTPPQSFCYCDEIYIQK